MSEVSQTMASIQLTTLDVTASDSTPHPDTCVEVGQYEFRLADGTTADQGKSVVVWTEEGGQWKVLIDMFSSNGAATAQ